MPVTEEWPGVLSTSRLRSRHKAEQLAKLRWDWVGLGDGRRNSKLCGAELLVRVGCFQLVDGVVVVPFEIEQVSLYLEATCESGEFS